MQNRTPQKADPASSEVPGDTSTRATSLTDYEIIGEIGRGGTAIVYAAFHKKLRRKVALKQLPAAAALDQRWLGRFQHEVRTTSQLSHSNIVPFYELGRDDDSYFYTMQLIDGVSLAEVIRRLRQCRDGEPLCVQSQDRPLHPALVKLCQRFACPPPGEHHETNLSRASKNEIGCGLTSRHGYHKIVAEIIAAAARALGHAHEHGILHLDIKPSNILIDVKGKVWVTDFGAARLVPDEGAAGTAGRFGTLRYMSPEQIRGDKGALDGRSDIYSLGATTFELLTLERWNLDRASVAAAQGAAKSTEMTGCNPPPLRDILEKATVSSRDQRYASACDLGDDLQLFVDNQLSPKPRSGKEKRKRGQDSFFGKRETRQTLYFLSEAGGDLRRTA